MTNADILVELRSDNSRLFKESVIIREMENKNEILFKGIKYALDKLITFGIKNIPAKKEMKMDSDLGWLEFEDILIQLIERKLTGNAAREAIKEFRDHISDHEWNNWYRLILIKDLKCGVSETTINNCAKKIKNEIYKVPVFSCQLAQDFKSRKKISGKKIVDVKLDGVRLLSVVFPDGTVEQFTRNGKVINNFDVIREQFKEISKMISEPMVFDGELISTNFQNLMKNIFRKSDIDTKDDMLFLFDMIPLKNFRHGLYSIKQINRLEKLHHLIKTLGLLNINVIDYDVIDFDDEHDLVKFNDINKKAISMGYEGVMVKDINAPYETKRTSSWLKVKPVLSFDLAVCGFEEGTGKYEGMLGSILCEGMEDGKKIFVSVGSGLNDEDRTILWNKKSDLLHKIVEIEADAITQNQNGSYSLRFPRFVRFRGIDDYEKM